MVKGKKGILKKTGCILISASIILTGVTFFGSSISEADVDETEITTELDNTDNSTNIDDPTLDNELGAGDDGQNLGGDDPVDPPANGEDITEPDTSADNNNTVADDENKGTSTETTDKENANGDAATDTVTTPEENKEQPTEETLNKEQMLNSSLALNKRTLATSLLTASGSNYTDPDTGAEYSDSSKTELVSVPSSASGYGNTFTVPSSVTSIAAGAFTDSDVLYITIEDASKITSISLDQGDWPKKLITIYCPNNDFDQSYALVDFANKYGTLVEVRWREESDDEPLETYTITYNYKLIDSTGAEVTTVEQVSTESVTEGTKPSGITATSYVYGGATYTRRTDLDPTISAAGSNKAYTYTFQSSNVVNKYTITIAYQLNDASGAEVTKFNVTDLSVVEGATPTYDAPATYTYNDAAYSLTTSPTLAPATKNDTYTYIYTQDANAYVIKYQLLNASGEQVAIQTIASTTDPSTFTPDKTYLYNNVTYNLTTTTPSVADKVYTYVFKSTSSSGGSGGGGSGSSGGGGGAGLVTPSGAAVSDTAKLTVKYIITEGAGQIVGQKDGAVRIVCNGPVEKLAYINIDGNIVQNGNYTIQSGSTILTLNADYVANLAVGDHAVQFQYTDGYAMTGLRITNGATKTTTTVTYKVASDGTISAGHIKDTTPKTADGFDTRYLLCLAIFLLGAGAIQLSKQKNLEAILAGEKDDYC